MLTANLRVLSSRRKQKQLPPPHRCMLLTFSNACNWLVHSCRLSIVQKHDYGTYCSGFGADQLQAGGLGSKRAATNPQSTTDRSPTQRVRASRSTPGMMNVSKKADASSTAPSELQYLAPIGQGVGANEAGGLDDTGTMHSVAYFTPASAALKRSHKGQSSAVLRQGHLRANEVRGGEHGADHAQPFALRESLAKLLHCRSKDHPEGVPAQVGESAHRDRSHAHGEGGRLMFGGEVQLGGRSVSPARMLQEIQGRRAQHSTHHSQADELDADSLKLFSHLSAGVIPPASLPGTAGSGRARADNPSHVSAGERGSSQAPGMQIIEKVWASDKSTTQETSKQVQHPQGRSQADSTIDSTRHAAAERKVDLLRQNQRSREPATVPSLRGKACGKDSSSNKIQVRPTCEHCTRILTLQHSDSSIRITCSLTLWHTPWLQGHTYSAGVKKSCRSCDHHA